jgi:hypothetical protein
MIWHKDMNFTVGEVLRLLYQQIQIWYHWKTRLIYMFLLRPYFLEIIEIVLRKSWMNLAKLFDWWRKFVQKQGFWEDQVQSCCLKTYLLHQIIEH